MGRWHADAVFRISGTISAIVDSDPRKAAQLIRRHPQAKAVPDVAGIVADGLADVIHICTPAETHEALAQQALQAGLHSIVEKPLTETAETTSNLLRLAESKNLLLCPVHQFLFQPGVLRAQAAIDKIGPLLHVDTVICSAGAQSGSQDADLVAADILPGPLSLLARLLPGAAVRIADWRIEHPAKGELRASTSVRKVSASMLISLNGRPTVNALRLIGERGSAQVDLFHGFCVLEHGTVSRAQKIAHPFVQSGATLFSAATNLISRAARRESAYPGLRELIRRFYEALSTRGKPPVSASEVLEVAAARDNILAEIRRKA
jgi:predicted dehydrogenase